MSGLLLEPGEQHEHAPTLPEVSGASAETADLPPTPLSEPTEHPADHLDPAGLSGTQRQPVTLPEGGAAESRQSLHPAPPRGRLPRAALPSLPLRQREPAPDLQHPACPAAEDHLAALLRRPTEVQLSGQPPGRVPIRVSGVLGVPVQRPVLLQYRPLYSLDVYVLKLVHQTDLTSLL